VIVMLFLPGTVLLLLAASVCSLVWFTRWMSRHSRT
jgi:hypothetical protein